jgi:Flp pilus assembly protein TadG
MTELALVVPIFMLLVLAIVDFGRMVAIHSAAVTASREAARYGSATGEVSPGVPRYIDCDGIRLAAVNVTGSLIDWDNAATAQMTITYDKGPTDTTPEDGVPDANAGIPTAQECVNVGSRPVPADIVRFDRVVVEVQVTYRPIAPIIGQIVGPITVTTIDRRTIAK